MIREREGGVRGGREREKGNKRVTEMYIVSTYCIPGNFCVAKFSWI